LQLESGLKALFDQVVKYIEPILSRDTDSRLDREENRVLALQNVHRLNQKIGIMARSNSEMMEKMKLLQNFINTITIGLKNDNRQQIEFGLNRARDVVATLP
jgi:hypothetical protein